MARSEEYRVIESYVAQCQAAKQKLAIFPIGLPGSGKTKLRKELKAKMVTISGDDLRVSELSRRAKLELKGPDAVRIADSLDPSQVFHRDMINWGHKEARRLFLLELSRGENVFLDMTNISVLRRWYFLAAKKFNYSTLAVILESAPEVNLRNIKTRAKNGGLDLVPTSENSDQERASLLQSMQVEMLQSLESLAIADIAEQALTFDPYAPIDTELTKFLPKETDKVDQIFRLRTGSAE